MPIPRTRNELVDLVSAGWKKLRGELELLDEDIGALGCVDDWSVKDLLAVRVWWTEHLVEWIEAGRRGEVPVTPAPGYRWKETPRLNADVVDAARDDTLAGLVDRLERGYDRVMATIDELDDAELLEPRIFEWAGSYPISRWISINTARQYTTARTYIRRVLRERAAS